jgi:geranylgeranylglycerol-phosphate geranylgeranyltransferase
MAVFALLEILRPANCLMAGLAAVTGLVIAGNLDLTTACFVFLAAFLVTGAGNAVNDYYDREIDAVNRPKRPIPSGRISPRVALFLSSALFVASCLLAGLASELCLGIAILNSVLLFFYARDLKAMPVAGNCCVSYLTGSTFLFGGAASGTVGAAANLFPAALSFLATMSREIVKDIEDMEGDRMGGARTLPLLAGRDVSSAAAAAFSLLAVVLSLLAPFGTTYLIIIAVADLFFLVSILKIARGDPAGSQRALKLGMALALLAFLAAALKSHL